MQIQVISGEEFARNQLGFTSANFLQSYEMSHIHTHRNVFDKTFFVSWTTGNIVVGQALIGIRKRMRFFKEAILLQGPLLQDEFLTELPEMMQLLEQLLREQGVSRVEMNPYLIEQVLDESLSIVADHRYQSLID